MWITKVNEEVPKSRDLDRSVGNDYSSKYCYCLYLVGICFYEYMIDVVIKIMPA